MGEKIKDLLKLKISNNDFNLELNKPTYNGGPRYIHLQSNRFRYNFTEIEFIEIVLQMNKAAKKIKTLKNIEE